ncbi:MAG: hypothetical protein M3P91_10230 [Actinomycetota bacterium]|nr:hypothetical protein [Actinomycetota bacterium]
MSVITHDREAAPRPAPDRPRRPAWLGVAVVGLATVIYLWLCWKYRAFVTDDSWISVRYAENLAAGHGFVWNPGGPRAEGYSNPLLVAVEAGADLAGGSALGAARALGVLSGLACVVLVYVRGRHVVGQSAAAIATLFTAASPPFAAWALGGLETLPVALVLTVALLELSRRDGGNAVLAAAVLALLPWLRPEGLAVAGAVVLSSEGAGLLRRRTRAAAVRRAAVLGGLTLASQVALEAFRLGVYGHLLPNSVIYKSGTGETFAVLSKFAGQSIPLLVLALVGLVLASGRQRLLAVAPLVYVAGSIGTLDSANGFSRFFMPVQPLLALLAGLALTGLAAGVGRMTRAGGAVLAAVAASIALAIPMATARAELAEEDITLRHLVPWWRASRPDSDPGWLELVWPLFALLGVLTLVGIVVAAGRSRLPIWAPAPLAAAGVLAVLAGPSGDVRTIEESQRLYMACKVVARDGMADWLSTTSPETSYAIADAGLVPARARRTAFDSLLLNEPLLQETGPLPVRERAELVHRQAPEVLVLASRSSKRFLPTYPTDEAIYDHPGMSNYRLVHVARGRGLADGPACRYHLLAYQR